jgi:hypothetical protein
VNRSVSAAAAPTVQSATTIGIGRKESVRTAAVYFLYQPLRELYTSAELAFSN